MSPVSWVPAHAMMIYDSVATVVWKSLKLAGVDTRRVKGWGSLFREV